MSAVNQNLEEDLVGLLLAKPDRYYDVAETLRAEHFKVAFCRAVFAALASIHTDGLSPTLSLVEDRIERAPQGVTVSAYLARLKVEAPHSVMVEDLASVLVDHWYREQGEVAARAIAKLPADQTVQPEDIPDRMITAVIDTFAEQRPEAIYSTDELGRDFLAMLANPSDGEGTTTGFVTGFAPFDDLMGPFYGGGVTIIAGATSMGKSALAQQIARTAALSGIPILFHTNEMTVQQAYERVVMQQARVAGDRIAKRTWNPDEGDRLAEAVELLRTAPLNFDGKEKPRVAQLKVRAQRMIAQKRIRAMVIDHLQFIEGARRGVKEFERLAEVTGDIKAMAKALDIHVFLVSHVNRQMDGEAIKSAADIRRPRLSDLHGSSTIEKDADNVCFVHRPVYYLERNEPDTNARHRETWAADVERWKGRAEIIKAKKRGGAGFGIREVRYIDNQTRFEPYEREGDLL